MCNKCSQPRALAVVRELAKLVRQEQTRYVGVGKGVRRKGWRGEGGEGGGGEVSGKMRIQISEEGGREERERKKAGHLG